jgi:hypothetical protein
MAVEVRFVSKRKLSTDDLRIVTEKLPGIWRQATPVISFKQLDAIPTRPGQKHIVFVNEWEAGITPRLQA